jgi:hypothetical protein
VLSGLTPAQAACTAPANTVRFVAPANGKLDVARFPAISDGFTRPVISDSPALAECIRLIDRVNSQN